jgi:hypothetical protein
MWERWEEVAEGPVRRNIRGVEEEESRLISFD